MRYSRLSASFIFIAQDTRAQTNSENFPERLLTRIYVVVVVVVGCCCCGAGSSSPGASSPAGQPVFAARHVSCLVDIYWRRLAAFPMMDFSANQTDRPTPPTCSVQTRNFTSPVPASRFSSLRFLHLSVRSRKDDEKVTGFLFFFSILSHASSIIEIKGFPWKLNPVLIAEKNQCERKLPFFFLFFSALVQIEFRLPV